MDVTHFKVEYFPAGAGIDEPIDATIEALDQKETRGKKYQGSILMTCADATVLPSGSRYKFCKNDKRQKTFSGWFEDR